MAADPWILYFAPGACSRVTLIALEACGIACTLRPVALMAGQQRSPEYLALNLKGKVPLLVTPQGSLTETLAIIEWLDATHPQAGLLPRGAAGMAPAAGAAAVSTAAWARAQAMSLLAWSASTLHPLVFRMRMMPRVHPDPATHAAIRAAAQAEMAQQLQVAEALLADGRPWLTGADWRIADSHVCWAFGRAVDSGLDASALPRLAALAQRHAALPVVRRALEREAEGAA